MDRHGLRIHMFNLYLCVRLETVCVLTASARVYTRTVLRLRAQAEKEQTVHNGIMRKHSTMTHVNSPYSSPEITWSTSRAPSPRYSSFSRWQHHFWQSRGHSPPLPSLSQRQHQQQGITFRSLLFWIQRAPLLWVFVPSPEEDWLSDKSVLECEVECRRAGVSKLLRWEMWLGILPLGWGDWFGMGVI
jgi:hypothetical protein